MPEEISDELFTKEMKILWQNCADETRNELGDCIAEYFEDERAQKVLFKLQCKIE